MKNVSGIRLTIPDLQVKDFAYDMYPVYEKDWFSINISFDSKEIRGTLGFLIKPPLHFHFGIAKARYLKCIDLLLGFEISF